MHGHHHSSHDDSHDDHGGGDGHGKGDGHGGHHDRLGMYVGITMALLGVMLAVCSAEVGGERTELVQTLVEQEHAHSQYVTQDIKHRVAIVALRQLHSSMPKDGAGAALDQDLKKIDDSAKTAGVADKDRAMTLACAHAISDQMSRAVTPNKEEAYQIALTSERYDRESGAASNWLNSFDAAIKAHGTAQDRYELGQLAAEIAIVLASIALMLKRRLAWYLSVVAGMASIALVIATYMQTSIVLKKAEADIEDTGKVFADMRVADKTTGIDHELEQLVEAWATTGPGAATPVVAMKTDEKKPEEKK